MSYVDSLVRYKRRRSREVKIGNLALGAENPVRVQTMLNTDTNDIDGSVLQTIKCVEAGAEYIRITAPGEKEAENLQLIKDKLREKGYTVPLIADIHFSPNAAEIAANIVEKVRINPGNYTDKKRLKPEELSDEDYNAEIERIRKRFVPLIETCKKNNAAMRIGTNHGSLSDRIMGKFGDTPEGMAESAMEFLRICKEQNYHDIVISMKASNTRIMVYATRLIVKKMKDEGMFYPIHLGVTEAGDGEDGRIKSAVGIGSLLADGIGDTIRVSLTEDPEVEIPVAKMILDHFNLYAGHKCIEDVKYNPVNPYRYHKRETTAIDIIGNGHVPVVIANLSNEDKITLDSFKKIGITGANGIWKKAELSPDFLYCGRNLPENLLIPMKVIVDYDKFKDIKNHKNIFPCIGLNELDEFVENRELAFLKMTCSQISDHVIRKIKNAPNIVFLLESDNVSKPLDFRAAVIRLINANCKNPVVFNLQYSTSDTEKFQTAVACDLGGVFIDGLGDGIMLGNTELEQKRIIQTSFQLLQSTGDRITKTEYISCPSCGRTFFDLMDTVAKIKDRTSHLTGLKIGVMGCIVNGPGEMADAHYGYVGAGKGKITLYKGMNIVKRAIPSEEAVEKLVDLIKENGDWVDEPA